MSNQPTQAQLNFIEAIEEYSSAPQFKGKTRQEANEYISKYKSLFELETTSSWAIERGYVF